MALVFVVARERRVRSRLWRQVGCRVADGLVTAAALYVSAIPPETGKSQTLAAFARLARRAMVASVWLIVYTEGYHSSIRELQNGWVGTHFRCATKAT